MNQEKTEQQVIAETHEEVLSSPIDRMARDTWEFRVFLENDVRITCESLTRTADPRFVRLNGIQKFKLGNKFADEGMYEDNIDVPASFLERGVIVNVNKIVAIVEATS